MGRGNRAAVVTSRGTAAGPAAFASALSGIFYENGRPPEGRVIRHFRRAELPDRHPAAGSSGGSASGEPGGERAPGSAGEVRGGTYHREGGGAPLREGWDGVEVGGGAFPAVLPGCLTERVGAGGGAGR